jgi:mutator protein MutT
MPAESPRTVLVTAAVIERNGTFLVTRRIAGAHLEGYWEFPGGKCDPGETLEACLCRELFEELGVPAEVGEEIFLVTHAYPDRTVRIHFFECSIAGTPRPLLGQQMRWVPREALSDLPFPPADAELIERLTRGPDRSRLA